MRRHRPAQLGIRIVRKRVVVVVRVVAAVTTTIQTTPNSHHHQQPPTALCRLCRVTRLLKQPVSQVRCAKEGVGELVVPDDDAQRQARPVLDVGLEHTVVGVVDAAKQ